MTLNKKHHDRDSNHLVWYVCEGCGAKIGVYIEIKGAKCNKCGQDMVKVVKIIPQKAKGVEND